jgi:hypothetical protein
LTTEPATPTTAAAAAVRVRSVAEASAKLIATSFDTPSGDDDENDVGVLQRPARGRQTLPAPDDRNLSKP